MEDHTLYLAWASTFDTHTPSLAAFLATLPYMSITSRKTLLTQSRVQQTPIPGSRMKTRVANWDTLITYVPDVKQPRSTKTCTLLFLSQTIGEYLPSAVFSGFISSAVRSAPYMVTSEADEIKEKGIMNEISAAIEIYQPVILDFRCFLSQDPAYRFWPLSERLEAEPMVSETLYNRFRSTIPKFERMTLYPKVSKKTVGKECRDNMRSLVKWATPKEWVDTQEGSCKTLEQIYHRMGIEVKGVVEVRSAWTYGIMKPRVYYARGGNVYHKSKYIQQVFNVILDEFEVCHRQNRYNPPADWDLHEDDILLIYDYTSFTSKLEEITRFIAALGDFYTGTSIQIIDTRVGLITIDLGELLHEYNRECNLYGQFDVTDLVDSEGPIVLSHTCGMLGVPGNISSCTLLHGIHTLYMAKSLYRSKCVGDDARIHLKATSVNWKAITYPQLASIGELAYEKVESWDHYTSLIDDIEISMWQYLKRPFCRVGGRTFEPGDMTIFPTLDTILGLSDGFHTFYPDKESHLDRTKRFSSQWNRLLEKLTIMSESISDAERLVIFEYQKAALRTLYKHKGRKRAGFYADIGYYPVFLPLELIGEVKPFDYVVEEYGWDEPIVVVLPECGAEYFAGYVGEVFRSPSIALLGLMEKLGYVTKEIEHFTVTREAYGDLRVSQYLENSYPSSYQWTVIEEFPVWAQSLIPPVYV